jgi:hypothetical protein
MTLANPTKKERREIWLDLDRKFLRWMPMSDALILRDLQVDLPSFRKATRDECIRFLVMDHASRMIGRL